MKSIKQLVENIYDFIYDGECFYEEEDLKEVVELAEKLVKELKNYKIEKI